MSRRRITEPQNRKIASLTPVPSNGIFCDFHPENATCNATNTLRRPSYGLRRHFNELHGDPQTIGGLANTTLEKRFDVELLSHAADISAGFVVMGGYGHSRLREFIRGGATRGMLAAMTVPCLRAH